MDKQTVIDATIAYTNKALQHTNNATYIKGMLVLHRNITKTLLNVFAKYPKDSIQLNKAFCSVLTAYNQYNKRDLPFNVDSDGEQHIDLTFNETVIYNDTIQALQYYGNLLGFIHEVCITHNNKLMVRFLCMYE